MMLSAMVSERVGWFSTRVRSSSMTRSGDFSRKAIVEPLRPQNVHWCFWPHQQPRLLSAGRTVLEAASESGNLLGSMAHGHANPAAVKNALYDVITAEFNGEYDAATAAQEMVSAVELTQ